MAKHEFNVPVELIEEFADILAEKDLVNEILGSTDDKEIIIEVEYDKNDRKDKHAVYKLHEMIDDFYEDESEDDSEEEEAEDEE